MLIGAKERMLTQVTQAVKSECCHKDAKERMVTRGAQEHGCSAMALGNGHGSREAEQFLALEVLL